MKRLLTLAAMFLCCMTTTFAQFSGSGSGTEDDPYLIFNENQLSQVSNFLNQEGVVFKLMKDMDLTNWIAENNPSQGWLPIGVESSPFMGKFYGNNHKITGQKINRTSTDHVGFFGYVTNATISDLTIEGTSVIGASNVGAFVGYISGSAVSNCHVKMKGGNGVIGASNVGGFTGYSKNTNYETFSVCATVSSSESLGGFAGKVESATFSDGSFSGELVSTGIYTGGLIGHASRLTLSDINVKCNITAQDYTGGIVGCNVTGSFTNCKYEGSLSGGQYVGGIVGALESSTSVFTSCFSKGKITATGDYVGGVIGVSQGACIEEMESCSHFGDIRGLSYVGGLLGAVLNTVQAPTLHTYESMASFEDENYHINWYYETISTGRAVTKKLNNCTAIGNIYGNTYIGGLIGYEITSNGYSSTSNKINDTYEDIRHHNNPKPGQPSIYSVTVGSYIYDGTQLVGRAPYTYYTYTRNTISLSLTNNYYSGMLQGIDNVGGLVGYKSGGTIQYNYAHANIYGSSNVGGIVGQVSSNQISNSYNTTTLKSNAAINGMVSATTSNVGRIYGCTSNSEYTDIGALGSVEGNRALTQTKVVLQGVVQEVEDDLQNGNSVGPSLLRLKATYVSMGWNFDENWENLETESYPYKEYQAAPPVIVSNLVSQAMGISGKSLNGGTVYLYYKDHDVVSTTCNGNNWTFATEPLQSGAQVQIYADVEGMTPSYFTTSFVGYPGSGTETDPYRIYTAEDLQGASNRGYYKLMNDIDLTQWINENSPKEGWPAIGRNSGEVTYIDGDNHKVTGLWIDTKENYNGLFSNFSAGQIKNLTIEVAEGKKVKGGDYTGILIGRNANGKIVNCTVKGDVEGTNHTGGVAGLLVKSVIHDIIFDGTITSSTDSVFVGGLAGQTDGCDVSLCNIKSVINLSGKGGKAGGLIGETKEGSIKSSKTQTTLTATGANFYAGGLVGYSETPIMLCSSDGSVTASGETTYSGGLVAYALSSIDNCYSAINTTGTEFSAGLVAYTFSTIDKCYASGNVSGYMYGAGIVGELDGPNARLTNSVACNNIITLSAQSSWGCRVIGGFKNGAPDPDESNLALSTMQVSLNGVPQKKTDDLVEGKATTLEVLKEKRTYELLGWDFSKVWEMEEGTSYPILQTDGSSSEPDPEPEPLQTDDDVISVSEIVVGSGNTTNFAINLTNKTTDLTAYQFDIVLPLGFTLATNEKGKYLVSKTDRYDDDDQTLNVSKIDDATNTYRIVCFSMTNEIISGTSGAILNAVLAIDPNIVDGTFEGKISDIVFTKVDGKQFKLTDAKFTIVVNSIILGDANGDGEVNVSDIVEIVNYIMGKPSANFVQAAADLNGDGEINVTDVVKVVSIIMSTNNSRITSHRSTMNNNLVLSGEGRVKTVTAQHAEKYTAAQFDICLGDALEIDDISLKSSSDHCLTWKMSGKGTCRVIIYSLTNSAFNVNGGELMSISLKDNNSNVAVENVLLVSAKNNTTDIDKATIDKNEGHWYTLDGCKLDSQPEKKGIYIKNGKKIVVK